MANHSTVATVRDFISVPEFETGRLLLGSAFASIVFAATTVTAGMSFIAWRAVGLLFLALLVLMTVELFTSFYSHGDKKKFPWNKAVARKVMIISLVVISLVLDMVVYQVVSYFPQEFMILDQGYLFVTMTTCIWLVAAEVTCFLKAVEEAGSEDVIPPTLHLLSKHLQWLLKSMKFIDRSRSGAMDGEPISDHPKRWYDEISDEEVERLAEFLQDQRRDPPEPVKPLEPVDEVDP